MSWGDDVRFTLGACPAQKEISSPLGGTKHRSHSERKTILRLNFGDFSFLPLFFPRGKAPTRARKMYCRLVDGFSASGESIS
ncbi:MAG: hypothetical protein ACP5JH_09335 [Bacteroidota bacterium]